MNGVIDISWMNLGLGFLLLIIPLIAFYYYKTGLVIDSLISIARMAVQLFLVGLYLEYLFKLNNIFVNIGWVIVMITTATFSVIKRSGLKYRLFFVPVFVAIFFSLMVVDVYFILVVVRLDNMFTAMYFIPLTGMLIGNCLQGNIIALSSYYNRLKTEQLLYRWSIANGASRGEALRNYMRDALKKSLNPSIATMAVIGLVSLPGMMTGQILGGSMPSVAIKYQIMIMISIFVAMLLSVFVSIKLANRFVFDEYDNLKLENRH
ncbi:MAG: ABC transporter permease [Bacteroidota bacterium]